MTTIEEVVEMWDKNHKNNPTETLKGKNVQPDGKIIFGSIFDRLNKWAIIKLSNVYTQWNKQICYVFDFKSGKPEINFQKRSGYPCDTEKLYEFLNTNFNGKEINGKKLTLARGRNPDNLILKINFDGNSSAKEICDCMEEFIKLTREKICNFLAGKDKEKLFTESEEKLSTESEGIFSEIMNKYGIKEDDKLYDECEKIYNQTIDISNALIEDTDKLEVSYYTQKNIAQDLLILPIGEKEYKKFRSYSTYGMNDPSEGKTLLSFLGIKNEDSDLPEYLPFIACFSLEIDNLNQFRLYGNENNMEATGVGIVFKPPFFNNVRDLCRCVYIDPDNKQIKSISFSKEEEKEKELIEKKQEEVEELFENLKKEIKKLLDINKHKLAEDLLINIRYLVKDYAFMEERECRIIDRIKKDDDELIDIHNGRLYITICEIKDHVDRIYFGPLAEGIEGFKVKIKEDIKCIPSRNPYKSKRQ